MNNIVNIAAAVSVLAALGGGVLLLFKLGRDAGRILEIINATAQRTEKLQRNQELTRAWFLGLMAVILALIVRIITKKPWIP